MRINYEGVRKRNLSNAFFFTEKGGYDYEKANDCIINGRCDGSNYV